MSVNTVSHILPVVALSVFGILMAQQGPKPLPAVPGPQAPLPGRAGGTRGLGNRQHQACLKQAGISRSAMARRRSLQETAKAQIQSVCSDSSLSQQQRMEKIHAIEQSTHQQMSGLLTPSQEAKLKECQRTQHARGMHMPGMGGAHQNPCANVLGITPGK